MDQMSLLFGIVNAYGLGVRDPADRGGVFGERGLDDGGGPYASDQGLPGLGFRVPRRFHSSTSSRKRVSTVGGIRWMASFCQRSDTHVSG